MKVYKTLIPVQELHDIYRDDQVVLIDCTFYLADFDKGRKEYMQSHIPGAYFLDILRDLSGPLIPGVTGRHPLPNPEVLTYTFRACGIHDDTQVIAYDQSNGVYASRAWWLLNWLGHDKVAVLNGGFAAWKNAGYETDNQWMPPAKGTLTANMRNELAVWKEEIKSGVPVLIDSREYKRFIGEIEPIDPIAGHIPGAVCMPYQENVDASGQWKSKNYLGDRFSYLSSQPHTPVFYCGSGVTACHNILAYKIGTGKDAKLYGGSFSEWINYYPVDRGD